MRYKNTRTLMTKSAIINSFTFFQIRVSIGIKARSIKGPAKTSILSSYIYGLHFLVDQMHAKNVFS
jgi:hypothetical protein